MIFGTVLSFIYLVRQKGKDQRLSQSLGLFLVFCLLYCSNIHTRTHLIQRRAHFSVQNILCFLAAIYYSSCWARK